MGDGKVVIELVGKDNATQAFIKGMRDMEGSVKSLEGADVTLQKLTSTLKGLVAAVGIGLSLKELWSTFKEVTTVEAALVKMAGRLNTTVTELTSLGVVARKTGMDTESFNMAIERMQKNLSNAVLKTESLAGAVDEFGEPLEKGARVFDELGLRAEVLQKLSLPDRLKEIASAMKDNIDPTDQSRVALELFGKAGGAMVLALKEGPEAIQAWIDKQEKLGITTDEMAKRGAEAKSAAGDLTAAWHQFAIELTDQVAPAVTFAISRLTDLIVAARMAKKWRTDFEANAAANPLAEGSWWIPDLHSGGGGGGGGWGEDLRKEPIRPGPKSAGGGGAGGGSGKGNDIQKEIEKIKREVESAKKEAMADGNEAFRMAWEIQHQRTLWIAEGEKLTLESHGKIASLWEAVMGDEKTSYQDRIAAAEKYKTVHLQVIDDEIAAIREKYGALVPADVLESYKKSQIDALKAKISKVATPEIIDWEAAWKRAAENVQDTLSNTIYNLATQTKTAGDIITNITDGVMQLMSQMAAQAIMNMAKMAMQAGGNWFSGLFGGGGMDYSGQYISAQAHGGAFLGGVQAFASGGVVTRPTLFRMANGMGLMGEAGYEAVMPLARTPGGDLGVKAAGGTAPQVNLTIINNSQAQVSTQQDSGGDLTVIIEDAVMKAYARRGPLHKLINAGNRPIGR